MRLRILLFSCLFFVLVSCAADDPTRHNTFIPLTAMEVIGTYGAMADQTINQYRAIGDFSGRFTRDITSEVSWRVVNKKIATVSSDAGSQGLVTAVSPGETSVIAYYGDFSASAPVVVNSSFLTAIEITPQDAELQVNITQQYEATGIFSDDSVQDITPLATWESSDPGVVTIDSAALAATVAPGAAAISAAWQGIAASTGLLVADATLTAITITPEDATAARGTTVRFTAEGLFSDDSTRDISDIVDWQSSVANVGIISPAGLAEGVAAGETEISASFDVDGGTLTATAGLTVTDALITAITITPENAAIAEGADQQFKATGTFSDTSEQDITDLALWSTSESSVGTISNSSGIRGLFISIGSGATTIEATFGGVSGETILTVE